MSNAIFGYGSLISPISLAGRNIDYGNIDRRYDNDKRLRDYHDRSKAIEAWEDLKSRGVEMHFVTLDGYKRYYSIKHRNGGMLEIYPDDKSHEPQSKGIINGTLFTDVPDDVYSTVSSSESMYEEVEVALDEFNYMDTKPEDLNGSTTMYVAESGRNSEVLRHPVYHDGILRAYVYLMKDEETVEESIVEEHLRMYLKHTYEFRDDEWRSLYSIDGEKDIERVREVVRNEESIY